MRTYAAAMLAVVMLAPACTGREEPRYGSSGRDSRPGPLSSVVDRCMEKSPEPVPDALAVLAAPGVWLHTDGVTERKKGAPVEVTQGRYEVLGGDPPMLAALPDRVGYVRMAGTVADSIGKARRLGADVVLKTGLAGDARTVSFAVASLGGEVVFLGDCAQEELGGPAHREVTRLGRALPLIVGQPSAAIRRVAGLGSEAIEFLLADGHVRVIEDHTPDELLAPYRPVWVSVRGNAAWDGTERICLSVELGRSACVHLNGARTSAARLRGWYDPRGVTEVWVHDARYGTRLARLGTVDVPRLARRAGFDPEKDGVTLRIDLAGSRTARPSFTARVAPCRVNDCEI